MVTLVLALAPDATEWKQASAQQTSSAEQTAPNATVPESPSVEAQAWTLTDAYSGLYLAGENPDEPLPAASTANIMTALVVLEEGVNPDEEVTISEQAESYVGTTYSNVGLIWGERLSIRDLLAATLIPSGTDAAYSLAEHVGDGSVENFVGMMNDKASELGLQNTRFEDPAGLEPTGNYSSAKDLAVLAREALEHSLFVELVDTPQDTISTQNREIEVFNTNQLLNTYPPATGVKTGTTAQGGFNLVASAESDEKSYIAVVLGAEDSEQRFQAARQILEYGFNRYELQPLVQQGDVYEGGPLPYRWGESVELSATEEVAAPIASSSEVERRVTTEELPQEAEAGEELGEIEVFVDGQSIGRSPLVTREGYAEATLWDKARYAVGWPAERVWTWIWG